MKRTFLVLSCLLLPALLFAGQYIFTFGFTDAAHIRYNDGCVGANCGNTSLSGVTHAVAGDTWSSCTWADDGNIYCTVDDTYGADYAYHSATGANLAFVRITGSPFDASWSISNVNQMTDYGVLAGLNTNGWSDGSSWKATGCQSLVASTGNLFCMVARQIYGANPSASGNPKAPWIQYSKNVSLIKTSDHGAHWTNGYGVASSATGAAPTSPNAMFTGVFGSPYPVDFGGQDGACPAANLFNCRQYSYWISTDNVWNNGQYYYLARVPKSLIANLNKNDWQFWCGGTVWGNAQWCNNESSATAFYNDQWHVSMNSMIYLPALQRFVIVSFYYPSIIGGTNTSSNTSFRWLECLSPAGPCSSYLADTSYSPQGYYSMAVVSKWSNFLTNSLAVIYNGDYGTVSTAPSTTFYTIYANTLNVSKPTGSLPTNSGVAK